MGRDLVCTFVTDEDRSELGVSGTPAHRLKLDVKSVVSHDDRPTWDREGATVYRGTSHNDLAGMVALPKNRLLCTFLDFDRGFLAGEVEAEK